jgi:RsmE family RNA methyltransferase
MNLILLLPSDFVNEGVVSLSGRRATHIREVHQAAVGRKLRVGLLNGLIGEGLVREITPDTLTLEVSLTEPPPVPLPVTLLLAMPRPKCFRRVIQCATTMGVKRIALFGAYRVEKSYWQSPWLEPGSLREQMMLGLEQARDTVMPEVTLHPLFKPFVEDALPGLTQGSRCWVAHPGSGGAAPVLDGRSCSLAIGPEGGFTEYELDALKERQFIPVALGPRILRTEHIVPALLGRWL